MPTKTNNRWKTCSRRHKYRGARCSRCGRGATKRTLRIEGLHVSWLPWLRMLVES